MKAEDLIRVLRKMIKEEVQKAVAQEVNKSMTRLLAEVISNRDHNRFLNERTYQSKEVDHTPEPPPQKHFVKDKRLNEVLNATIPDLAVRESSVGMRGPKVSLTDMFNKIDSNEDVVTSPQEQKIDMSSKMNMIKSIVTTGPVMQQTSVLDVADSTPLAGVFKKDFRTMMKKIDKVQKNGGGGGMFAGAVPMTPQIGGYDQP